MGFSSMVKNKSNYLIFLIFMILCIAFPLDVLAESTPSSNNPTTILDVIKNSEGIIGTLMGVLLGWLITFLSQKIGRIYFYVNEWEFNFYTQNKLNEEIVTNNIHDCHAAKYRLEADFFNSSNIHKGLRNVRVVFKNKNFNYEYEPNDLNTLKTSNRSTFIDKMKPFTTYPKQFIRIHLKGSIRNETELKNILKSQDTKVYLKALNYKNKKFKWYIVTI
jgi:hypothetical protein